MKKFLILPLILLSSCIYSPKQESISYQITEIKEKNNAYEISISLSRPDLLLKQPTFEMSLTDLQKEVMVKDISINGNPCLINEIPAKCEISDLKGPFTLKADFPDKSLETKMIVGSFDFSLSSPEILHPLDSDDKTVLVFEDVFADSYELELMACYDENNCQVSIYDIKNEEGVWSIFPRGNLAYFAEISHPSTTIKTVFKFDPSLFETVSYSVKALKKWPSLPGMSYSSEKIEEISF